MFRFLISCLYFFLPAYFTNMTPPLAKKTGIYKYLNRPVDFNRKFLGKPVLGSHKTWRGVILGITIGMIVAYVQVILYRQPFIESISFLNYEKENVLLLGFLLSGGAVLGDLVSAFFKRRLDLKPGAKFVPFDQTNYVFGACFLFNLTNYFKINITVWLTLFVITFFLHIIVNRIGYHLKLHKAKW